jgi:2-hydroxychromene-2-carboxylate isomerase/gamma-glutamylcyclotransferase (GGCT)/AIG2-like uncharacterized protein YtfP
VTLPLFVYGTLRQWGSNAITRLVPGARLLGHGSVRGQLYDVGTYPHLILDDAAGDVVGELYEVPEAGWPVLDELETIVRPDRPDGEYFKRTTQVTRTGPRGRGDATFSNVNVEANAETSVEAIVEAIAEAIVYVGNPAVMPMDRAISGGDWIAYAAQRGITAFTRTPRSLVDASVPSDNAIRLAAAGAASMSTTTNVQNTAENRTSLPNSKASSPPHAQHTPMQAAQWYFDLISPYAYLHWKRLPRLRDKLAITPVPVLFAGLLKGWGHKGPAEIPAKRTQTYRACVFYAAQAGIPFRFPPVHPFNPLAALRLVAALGASVQVVEQAFHFVWGEGRDPASEFDAFARALGCAGVDDAQARIEALRDVANANDGDKNCAQETAKQTLIRNTENALQLGVYGVPTLQVGSELFWGNDALEMCEAWLANPMLFSTGEMARVAALPVGMARKEAGVR